MEQLKNKPVRDVEPSRRQPAAEERRRAQEHQSAKEAEKIRTEEAKAAAERRATATAQYGSVVRAMRGILERDDEFAISKELPQATQDALTLLHQARSSQNETTNYAAGTECMKYLNKALATLQPVLSTALIPNHKELLASYNELQSEVGALRFDIKQRIGKEAHVGRIGGAQRKESGDREKPTRSALGSIAWELAQLVRKRKRVRFAYDLATHPIGHALEALNECATSLGKQAVALASIDEKLAANPKNKSLQNDWAHGVQILAETVFSMLARSGPGSSDVTDPGHYANLADLLAPLVESRNATSDNDQKAVLQLALSLVNTIEQCSAQQDELVQFDADASVPQKKRGVLGSLFGRKNKS